MTTGVTLFFAPLPKSPTVVRGRGSGEPRKGCCCLSPGARHPGDLALSDVLLNIASFRGDRACAGFHSPDEEARS